MKFKAITLMLLFGVFISCESNEVTSNDTAAQELENESTKEVDSQVKNTKLTSKSVGDFVLGESVDTTIGNYKFTAQIITRQGDGEGSSERTYQISKGGEKLLVIVPEIDEAGKDKIHEIKVLSKQYKNDQNIGVGTTMKEFMEKNPRHKIWYTYVSDRYIIETGDYGGQFILDPGGFEGGKKGESDVVYLKADDFSPETQIIQIRIF